MNGHPPDVADLVDGLAAQRGLYADMEALAVRQKTVLASGSEEALEGLLREKQAILEKIGAVEARIAAPKQGWKETRTRIDAARRAEVERLMDEVGAVLQRLLALETEGHAMLEDRRRRAAEQIQSLRRTRHLPQTYKAKPPGPAEPRFLDENH